MSFDMQSKPVLSQIHDVQHVVLWSFALIIYSAVLIIGPCTSGWSNDGHYRTQ